MDAYRKCSIPCVTSFFWQVIILCKTILLHGIVHGGRNTDTKIMKIMVTHSEAVKSLICKRQLQIGS